MATGPIEDINVGFGADIGPLQRAMREAVGAVAAGGKEMESKLDGAAKSADLLKKALGGIAVGAFFRDSIAATVDLGTEIGNLSRRFQITTQEASYLSVAIDDAFISAEEFGGAANGLNRQLRSNEERLNAMGIKTRDATGALLDQKQVMFGALDVLRQYKAGTDQNLAAQVAFGRGMTEETLQKLFQVQDNMADAEASAKKFGLVMGVENVQAAREFKVAQDNVGDAIQGVQVALGNAFLPALTSLLNILTEAGAEAIPVVSFGFKTMATSVVGLTTVVYDLWQIFKAMFNTIAIGIFGVGDAITSALSGDLAGAYARFQALSGTVEDQWSQALSNIGARTQQTVKDMEKIWSDPAKGGDQKYKMGDNREGAKSFRDPAKEAEASKKLMEQFKRDLEMLKAVQGDYYELAKADEVKFWQDKLTVFAEGSDQEREVYLNYLRAKREMAKENLDLEKQELDDQLGDVGANLEERIRLQAAWADRMRELYGTDSKQYRDAVNKKIEAERDLNDRLKQFADERKQLELAGRLGEFDMLRELADFQVSVGYISAEERLRIEREFISQRYQLQLEDLKRQAELYAGDTVKQEQIRQQRLILEQQLARDINALQIQQQQIAVDSFNQMFGGLFSTMEGVLQGLLTRTLTWRGAMQQVVGSLMQSFIRLGLERVKAWVMSEVLMTNATKAGAALRAILGMQGTAATVAAKTAEANVVIGANAGEAASGAAASQAAIPFIGPALAVAAAAAMLALVLGFKSQAGGGASSAPTALPSAAGGWWDIPRDTLAMVHKKEMVMPGELAEGVRNMVEGGESGGGGPTIIVQAMDSKDVARFFDKHKDTLMGTGRRAAASFSRG